MHAALKFCTERLHTETAFPDFFLKQWASKDLDLWKACIQFFWRPDSGVVDNAVSLGVIQGYRSQR